MKELYFAPLNFIGHKVYRHFLLKNGCDFVFTELIQSKSIENEIMNRKLETFPEDLDRTIFQIGVNERFGMETCIKAIIEENGTVSEINLNMGCPHSTMLKNEICGGILQNLDLMKELCDYMIEFGKKYDFLPSVKIRTGTNPDNVILDDYLKLISDSGISKVYIHARTLRYGYNSPANYNPLNDVKNKFPKLKIILNGDIDCYEKYSDINSKFGNDGIMIGRAALYNMMIFEQIKSKIESKFNPELIISKYDPVQKNAYLKDNLGDTYMSEFLKSKVLEFLNMCLDENISLKYVRINMGYILRGFSGCKEILKKINTSKSIENIIETISNDINSN